MSNLVDNTLFLSKTKIHFTTKSTEILEYINERSLTISAIFTAHNSIF